MRVNLVFVPYVSPSCLPIGVASLKSYLEKNSADTQVRVVDLNIDFVKKVAEGEVERICSVCEFRDEFGEKPFDAELPREFMECFRAAKSLIKNRSLFYNKELFAQRVEPLHLFMKKYSYCFSLVLRHYLEGRISGEEVFDFVKDEVEGSVEGNPGLVGFSALTDSQTNFALALGKLVKAKYKLPVVFGGPAFFNLDLKELMEAFAFIDFIVVKEGEEGLLSLVKALSGNESYADVPNLVWRRDGEIVFNGEKMIEDLDVLPTPDYSDLKLDEYYFPELILPISSARDCPWKSCKFCQLNAQYGGKYRQRSIKKVIDDIKVLNARHGASNFFFTDSEVTALRLREIGQALSAENLHTYFGCYARPTKDMSLETLKTAFSGGCRFLQLGVESFSDEYLRFVNKGTTHESIVDAIRNADETGIKLLCYMLGGVPTQTREALAADLREIASMQKQYNIFSVMYCLYSLGKHQQFYADKEKYGIEVTGRREVFSTASSKIVHGDDSLQYSYKDRTAYHLLRGCEYTEVDSPLTAVIQLANKVQELGINGENMHFIYTINSFLFETQLLYSKGRPPH